MPSGQALKNSDYRNKKPKTIYPSGDTQTAEGNGTEKDGRKSQSGKRATENRKTQK
jgi:hypothetical protein